MLARHAATLALLVTLPAIASGQQVADSPAARLGALVQQGTSLRVTTQSAEEYAADAATVRSLLAQLDEVPRDSLGRDDQVDYDLLRSHLRTRLFETDELTLHAVRPMAYLALSATDRLFLRPGAVADAGIREALAELRRLPTVLANGKANLRTPARVWTELAIRQARYARILLDEYVPTLRTTDQELERDIAAALPAARAAVDDYRIWLERELLPRSTRSPTWKPAEIEFYQAVQEWLPHWTVDSMLVVAEAEARQLDAEMRALAKEIHPSGDLRTAWELMKSEAPPWPGVMPMARRYVEMTVAWLTGPGSHVVTIPDFDYGVVETTPMARLSLSFGGASYGPTVAGRLSGYYVLTPPESWLTDVERAGRLKSYNPYWTHVISYHEWLGHTAQRASKELHATRPMRRAYGSAYFSQAWSFYLEKLLEDEGYFAGLPHMEALKTRMARRQMRMWRVQRIITKLRMAKGTMSFDEAVRAYVDRIGMEPANAWLEVARDCQTPSSPGREIIGELEILRLRREYQERMGPHYTLRRFNDTLLRYGDLPFAAIRRLMFAD
jgi:uncharacterized protein (DUF885 family)